MGKKGKKGARIRALKQSSTKDEKPNLFERMFNRKKFDILGKKAKGQQKKLGQSRSEAVEKVRSRVAALRLAHCCRDRAVWRLISWCRVGLGGAPEVAPLTATR